MLKLAPASTMMIATSPLAVRAANGDVAIIIVEAGASFSIDRFHTFTQARAAREQKRAAVF